MSSVSQEELRVDILVMPPRLLPGELFHALYPGLEEPQREVQGRWKDDVSCSVSLSWDQPGRAEGKFGLVF